MRADLRVALDPRSEIITGCALDVLRALPEASVHCCVTSPPYWALRDYGVSPSTWGDGWVGCLGLEPTPEMYIAHIVEIFREVRRVLRDDGTLWLNLGDCYAAGNTGNNSTNLSPKNQAGTAAGQRRGSRSSFRRDRLPRGDASHKAAPGLKPKDLVGIPWMAAFALRADGWYLRSDIIWSKNNPMPESIRDRPTKSHEYLFLLSKNEDYFYDPEPIREGVTGNAHSRGTGVHPKALGQGRGRVKANASFSAAITAPVSSRNRRSVWALSTQAFKGAHFATFPERLVDPCIKAGTSAHGCCSMCGAPFTRIIKRGEPLEAQKAIAGADAKGEYHGKATKAYTGTGAQNPSAVKARILAGMRERITVGWKPGCRHTLVEVEPCVVLDPFSGSGTSGLVARKLGRSFVGIEINPAYAVMGRARAVGE